MKDRSFRYNTLLLIFLFLYILWHLYYLDKYTLPDIDDAWLTEPVWRLFMGKGYSSEMFTGVYGLEKVDVYHGRIYSMFHIPILIFGPKLYWSRFSSLIAGCIVLFFSYLLAKKFFNETFAIASVIVLCLSQLFILLSHKVRQDMALTAFLVLSVYLFFTAFEKKSKLLFFFVGLVSSLSIDIHLNGILVVSLIIVLFLYRIVDEKQKLVLLLDAILWCLVGIITGIFWWIYSHILIEPDVFFAQLFNIILNFKPELLNPPDVFYLIRRIFFTPVHFYWFTSYHRGIFELLLIVIGVVLSILNKETFYKKKYMYVILLALFIMIPVLSVPNWNYYFFVYPFAAILIVDGFHWFTNQYKIAVLPIIIVLAIFINIIPITIRYYKVNYGKYAAKIKNILPANTRIFSDVPLWFSYPDKFYPHFAYYEYKKYTGKTLLDFLKERNIKYLVLAQEEYKKLLESNKVYRDDFNKVNKRLVAEVEDEYFGGGFSYCPLHKFHKTQIYEVIY